MSFRPRNRVKAKKKGLHRKLKSFCPRNQVKTKKKYVLTGPFSYDQPALKSRLDTR